MQPINIPGVGTVNFPDGMSNDDITAAIQKNYPQLTGPQTQHPDDSPFLKGIKDFGNEAARVGAKTITGLPLMAGDAAAGLGNLASRVTGIGQTGGLSSLISGQPTKDPFQYPSDVYNSQLDAAFPAPTNRAGKMSEGLSTLVASLGLPGPEAPAVVKQSLTGADAMKAEAMAQARNNGIVIPPSLTRNPPVGANLANGWGGSAETLKGARDINTPGVNALIAKDVGLDAGSQLSGGSDGTITGQINDAVKAGYAPLRDIGSVPVDQAHRDFVTALAGADRGAANISPVLGNPQIARLSRALMPKDTEVNSLTNEQTPPTFQSSDLVDAISSLRAKAKDAYASGNNTVGAAYKKAAGGFESLIDRHLTSSDDPDAPNLLANFRLARTRIAKGNDALSALNPATGDIDPRILAGMEDGQMTGGSKAAATIAQAFPDAVVPAKGTPSAITAFQANAGEAASNPYGFAASILGRPIARNYALGDKAQQALMQPKGKTLTRSALDAVYSNPAAFASLYEDANH